ncbi:hypothetical protein ADICYQ_1077 [Cyclobacterium qasimii M12-11B]|uniref:Secretion system C-terminal sorting domain-containing protein n=1 Tax=Cyclobacterium qasimii M12-11B TaxID=641524 RepID=S7X265_9BACT|nr:hypothetical protein ADICYQ_1077 [Cyclobacterium qasimii M12-11B]
MSSPGIALGISSYKSKIELRFDSSIPANTTTYVRIDADESLLQSLLGGSLGDLLSGVLGSVLLGRQEIVVEARTSSSSVMAPISSLDGFDNNYVNLVNDEFGNSYLAITPNADYDRILITNQALSGVGFGSQYFLDVYHAFYIVPDLCDYQPTFTSFEGSGITLDALELADQIESLHLAIDDDLENTSSQISLGTVGVAGVMEQKIYFNTSIPPGNEILISMAIDESLLDLGLFNNVDLIAYSNGSEVSTTSASSLLDLDVLGLLDSGDFFRFPISDDEAEIDQIGIRISSLFGLGVLEGSLQISGVSVKPVRPVVETLPEIGGFEICEGEIVSVTPSNEAGGDLHWYQMNGDSEVSLGIANTFRTTESLPSGEHIYLVKATTVSCSEESEPVRFKVKVNPTPKPSNYEIQPLGEAAIDENGKYVYVEGVNPVTLQPTIKDFPDNGDFKWYLDETMTNQLFDGEVIDNVLYELEGSELTMYGLEFRDEFDPYVFYIAYIPDGVCAPEEPMKLDLSSILTILNVNIIKFEGEQINKGQIKLDWLFTGIKPNEIVTLYRSSTDLQFEELASFTGDQVLSNTFIDYDPLVGNNYYKLEVDDELGQSRFVSQLKRVQKLTNEDKTFSIYPNNFENDITIRREKNGVCESVLMLYSGNGKMFKTVGFSFSENANKYTLSDLGGFPSGNYFLKIITEERSDSFHLLKK